MKMAESQIQIAFPMEDKVIIEVNKSMEEGSQDGCASNIVVGEAIQEVDSKSITIVDFQGWDNTEDNIILSKIT